MSNFDKVVRIGTIPTHTSARVSIFCHIKFVNSRLSITGVEGPKRSGNAYGVCGQIVGHFGATYDIGAIDSNASWPTGCIDWKRAASELAVDYSSVTFDGRAYYYR